MVLLSRVNGVKIRQHAQQDDPSGYRFEVAWAYLDGGRSFANRALRQVIERGLIERTQFSKRVRERATWSAHAHQEVSREGDSFHHDAASPCHPESHHRKRDRYAQTSVEHVVDVAVARVVVIGGVTAEASALVDLGSKCAELIAQRRVSLKP